MNDEAQDIYIEITYPDGTIARWVKRYDLSPLIEQIENMLGEPNTIKL